MGYCGMNCSDCEYKKSEKCIGCEESSACPFGKKCFIGDYISKFGKQAYIEYEKKLICEINSLHVPGLPEVTELFALSGAFVNLAYPLPSGNIKLLDDCDVYLGCQLECEFNDDSVCRCFGVVASPSFIIVAEYGENGADPELVTYTRR